MNYNPHDGEKKAEEPAAAAEKPPCDCMVSAIRKLLEARYPGGMNATQNREARLGLAGVIGTIMAGASDEEQHEFNRVMNSAYDQAMTLNRLRSIFGDDIAVKIFG